MSHPDVVVVGAGVIGMACARELAGAGLRVELLERLHQGHGGAASRAAAGMLAPLHDHDTPPPLLAACRASRDLWTEWAPALEAEAGMTVEYDRSGALQLALDDEDEAALELTAAAARRLGEPAVEIDAAELARLTPGVANRPEAVGWPRWPDRHRPEALRRALHFPGEHRVDNIRVCAALAAALQRRGVATRHATRVDKVTAMAGSGGPAVHVETGAGAVEAGLLVLAAGAWSGAIPGLPRLPVRPVRGQMALLGGVTWPWRGISRRHRVYFVRRGDDGLLVGATLEEAGFACYPTVAGIGGLLDLARRSYPELGEARLEASWAGLRPGTPDDLPIIGPLPGWPALAVTGHHRNGILLAPWTARQVAALATSGAMPGPAAHDHEILAAFSPARFQDLG
jgi:glycine oxidase